MAEGMRMSKSDRPSRKIIHLAGAVLLGSAAAPAAAAPASTPEAFGVNDRAVLLLVHAVGAQVYECKADAAGYSWSFREPTATLISDGKTVGRHYAGPNWELADGSVVKGKPSANAPGATANDVPLLKLDVIEHRGGGVLKDANVVLRLNTHGGALKGGCEKAGDLRAEPYSADYAFLK
jgi:uncharacterized protein DUF3455